MTLLLDHLTSWHGPWRGHQAIVVGLGAAGFSVVDTLVELGVEVTVLAREADDDVVNIAAVLGARIVVSDRDQDRARAAEGSADFAVISPGVADSDPAVQRLRELDVPMLSEIDFAWRVRDKYGEPTDWIVVAGERHQALIAEVSARILRADNRVVGIAGFESSPVLDLIRDPVHYDLLIVQASTASLAWWGSHGASGREPLVSVAVDDDLSPSASVVFEGTKLACVYNRGAGPTELYVEDADVVEGARAIGIGLDSPGMSDIGMVEGILCDRAFLDDRRNQALEISTLEELHEAGWDIPGVLPALLAAVAIARSQEVSPALIAGVLSLP